MSAADEPSQQHSLPICSLLVFHGGLLCAGGSRGDMLTDYAVREVNVLLWISLIAVTALLLRKVVAVVRLWDKGRRIPGPPSPFFYGHAKLLSAAGSKENVNDFLLKSHAEYGSVIKLWLGPSQMLVSIKDPFLIREVLEKAEDKLPLTGRAFHLAFGPPSLFVSSFEKVQHRWESLTLQLSQKLLGRANEVSLEVANCVMERVGPIMTKGLLDCRFFSQNIAFSVLGATLFGETFLAWSNATAYGELFMLIAKDACFWASFSIPPIWKRGYWRYLIMCRRLKCLTWEIVQQCKRKCKLHYHSDHFCKTQNNTYLNKQAADNSAFASEDIMAGGLCLEELNHGRNVSCGSIMGIMFHGCLTTASLIGSILTGLVMHPEIQTRIYMELVGEKNTSAEPSMKVQNSTLLIATIYEAARLLPVGPLLQRCSVKHDLNLKSGIIIPAGARIVVPVQLVQLDKSCWGADANHFNPSHFISQISQQEFNVGDKHTYVEDSVRDCERNPLVQDDPKGNAAFIPFGSGSRACVGQRFAILAIANVFASLLPLYEIKLQPDCENDLKPTMNNCVLQQLPSLKIMLVKRD